MPRDRVDRLLAFDLALMRGETIDDEARDGAPHLLGAAGNGRACPPGHGDLPTNRAGRRLTLAGLDEVGRGALAGPVAVGCVAFPAPLFDDLRAIERRLAGIDDSKCLSPKRREHLFGEIVACAATAVGFASAAEIDSHGIVAACRRAARRAYARLGLSIDLVVLDRGLSLDGLAPLEAVFTHGDSRSLHVAAASIVAKVTRDRLLVRLDAIAEGYGLAVHKGYGTAAHRAALCSRGVSVFHRRTFIAR